MATLEEERKQYMKNSAPAPLPSPRQSSRLSADAASFVPSGASSRMPGGLGGTSRRVRVTRAYPSAIESVGRGKMAHVIRAIHGAPLSIRFVAPGTPKPDEQQSAMARISAAAEEVENQRRVYTHATFSRAEAKELRSCADDAAQAKGGGAPPAFACCTANV